MNMRRKDREIVENSKIDEIIMGCDCMRIGLVDGQSVYMVPLNFGYRNEAEKRTFYFHGAMEGRKKELILKNGYAGFEMDRQHKLIEAEVACDYSFAYQSVIGSGSIMEIKDIEEKKQALDIIMEHYAERKKWEYSEALFSRIFLFKLQVEEISCKEH